MPIKNGRIYIDKSKTPKIGVSVHEIARCIGVGTLDLGELCTHDKVNMFSRKKSVEIPIQEPNRATDWWRGTEGNCGIAAPARVSSFFSLLSQYDGKMNGWVRVKPVTWNRANDFDGYYHYAQPPIKEMDSMDSYFKLEDTPVNVSIAYNEDDVDENGSGSLKMSDIIIDNQPLNDWYLGVVIFDESGSNIIGFNATQKGAEIETLSYPTTKLLIGSTYLLVPFYSRESLDDKYGDGAKSIMALPIIQPVKFKVVDPSKLLSIGVDATWSDDKSSISFTVEITNNGTGDRAVTSSYARLMVERDGMYTPDEYWSENLDATTDFGIDLGITNVPKDGISISRTQRIAEANRNKNYVLLVRLYGAGINFDFGPEWVIYEKEEA